MVRQRGKSLTIKYLDSKRIRGSSTATSPAPTFEENFEGDGAGSPTTWDDTGSNVVFNTTTNVLDWDAVRDGNNHSASFDLQDVLGSGNNAHATAWVLRYKFVIDAKTGGSSSSNKILVGLSSHDHDTAYGSTQDSISMRSSCDSGGGTDTFTACDGNGEAMDGAQQAFSQDSAVGTYYVEIIRKTLTTATINLYNNTGFDGTLLETEDFTPEAGNTDLRYIVIKNRDDSNNSGVFNGTIDEIKFYNGVTVVTTVDEKATLAPATDSLGSNGNVTNQGADLLTSGQKFGTGCLDFTGSPDYVDMSPLIAQNVMTTTGTIAFWVKFDVVSNGKTLWSFSDSNGTDSHLYMEIESDQPSSKFLVQLNVSGTAQWACRMATGLLVADQWHHFAVTQDGTSVKVYLDGVDRTIQSVTTDTTKWLTDLNGADAWNMGRLNHNNNTASSSYPDMKIDDFAIWNTALPVGNIDGTTAGSINHLRNGGTGRLATTIPTGLRVYYNCDSATITNEAPTATSDLPENTLFEETDTRETYFLQDNTGISKAGCLGWWKFQEQSGNVINHATTANGFTDGLSSIDGVLSSSSNISRSAVGKFRSYAFEWTADNHTSQINVTDQSALDITGDITVTAWIYPTGATNHDGVFLSKRQDSGNCNWQFFHHSSDKLSYHDHTNNSKTASSTNITHNTWQFVVFTIGSNTLKIYKNAVLQDTFSGLSARPTNSAPLAFGSANYNSGAEEWIGRMQDVTIWNRALSEAELTTMYNSGHGMKNIASGLAWY